jgi:hypothetical protein
MSANQPATVQVYQLRVTLRHISPLVWRRLQVTSETTIAQLHHILQIAMGWEDLHLHQFRIYGKAYGIARVGGISFADDPQQVRLAGFKLRAGERFVYEYDVGDFWQHDIRLEQVLPLPANQYYPRCTAGAGDCPPEDCGGPWGYRELLRELGSWAALEEARADNALVAQRLLDWGHGGPPLSYDDPELRAALDRMRERQERFPTAFNRRAANAALREEMEEMACNSASR